MENQESVYSPFSDMLNLGSQLAKGAEAISKIDVEDIDVGITPKKQVMQVDKMTLHHYEPVGGVKPKTEPVLIVYGLVGRYTMIDLQEDRSLVRNLLSRGVDVYVVDWGYPSRADQHLSFDDYVAHSVDECVNYISNEHDIDKVSILGICEGGTFSAMYAARFPKKVKNLILTITPIDFSADIEDENPNNGFINLWTRNLSEQDINDLIYAFGNLPGEFMSSIFQAMTPIRSMTKYNLDLLQIASNDDKLLNFLRMEKWLADRPNHPGAAARQWLIDLYKENSLVKGEFELEGELLDLKNITMPVLNIYAQKDHIIPPLCSTALSKHVGSKDYTELSLSGGHVGVYVSSKSQGIVGDGIYDWLIKRQG